MLEGSTVDASSTDVSKVPAEQTKSTKVDSEDSGLAGHITTEVNRANRGKRTKINTFYK